MIDLAENVRGYAAFRLFVYTHILVLRASWGPEHEDQEALPRGTEDLESWTFRTSGRSLLPVISDLSTTFLIAFTCSRRIVNDCKFRWFKAFKRGSSKLLLNRKRAEVLKSRTSNPLSQSLLVLMLRPPGGSGAENAAQKRRLGSPKTQVFWKRSSECIFLKTPDCRFSCGRTNFEIWVVHNMGDAIIRSPNVVTCEQSFGRGANSFPKQREPIHRLRHCRICNVLAFYIVSLAAVFWMSRSVTSKKAASRETTFSRDAQKRFEYATCWWVFFWKRRKKSPFSKISGKYPVPSEPVKRCEGG